MPLINNKMKQVVGGNWGKPRKEEQHIKVKNFIVESETIPNKKKPKKDKQKYICPGDCCPFCQVELPVDKLLHRNYVFNRSKKCPDCGAVGDKKCPACKKEAWLLNGMYKHQWLGCGFEGKKLKK